MDDNNDRMTMTTVSISQILISVTVAFLFSLIIVYKWKRRHLEKLAAQFPGPFALPVIGNALEFLGSPEECLQKYLEMNAAYGRSFLRIWLGPALIVVINKPEDIQIVLNHSKTLNKGYVYKFFRCFAGNGLVTAPVEIWHAHKRLITPAFNMRLLEQFIPIFCKYSMALVDKLKPHINNNQSNIWSHIITSNLSIILETAFGIDEKTPQKMKFEFTEAFNRLSDLMILRSFKFWLQSDFIFSLTSYGTEAAKLLKQFFHLPNMVIEEKKRKYKLKADKTYEQRKQADPELKVFIDILMELSESGAKFTDDELRDEVVTMIIAGHDTTAQTMCFCLLMLAMHQDVQEKVYEEMYRIFDDSDREVTMEDMKRMTYTEMVIKETLRKFPILPLMMRYVEEDIDLTDNYKLPAGCSVIIPPIFVHKDPEIYSNYEMFNPENFTPENIANRHRYSYLAFSHGPRSCLGKVYAMLSMKTTIACLIRKYRLFTDVKMEEIKLTMDFLLRFSTGYPVKIIPRKPW